MSATDTIAVSEVLPLRKAVYLIFDNSTRIRNGQNNWYGRRHQLFFQGEFASDIAVSDCDFHRVLFASEILEARDHVKFV